MLGVTSLFFDAFLFYPVAYTKNKLFENAKINKMWHVFLAVLYPVIKYFTTVKVEK